MLANPIQGGLYYVADDGLTLPPNDDRYLHERRPVVIVSGRSTNNDPDWPVVLVVPTSSSTKRKTRVCVTLNHGDGNLDKKTWARVAALQPILKTDLQDRIGVLNADKLAEVLVRVFKYMDLE